MRLASQLLYPTLLARADVETLGGAEVDGTVGARRRQRGFRHRRGSFLSRRSWRGRRRQRRRRHTLQRHFTTTFIGDVDGVGTLIAEARDHVFVVLENASGFGCHAFQPAVTQILIKFESGASDILLASRFTSNNIICWEVFDVFSLILFFFGNQPLAFSTWTFFGRGTFNRSTCGVAALAFVLVHSDPFAFFAIGFVFLGACFGLAFHFLAAVSVLGLNSVFTRTAFDLGQLVLILFAFDEALGGATARVLALLRHFVTWCALLC